MSEGFDPRALRSAFGSFATGVTVVTSMGDGAKPLGFTANSFASVSLDPPLLLVCLARTSRNFQAMTTAKGFAVNILAETQEAISNIFARPSEDRFAGIDWAIGPFGSPVLGGAAAWFDCSLHQVVEAGDHVILLGKVEAFENSERSGLGYARGKYFIPALAAKAVSAAAEGHLHLSAIIERRGEILLAGQDVKSLPGCDAEAGDPLTALHGALAELTGLPVSIGFLYSVYEDKTNGRHHVVYRATAEEGEPRNGCFVPLTQAGGQVFESAATAEIINRFVMESSLGHFGVYVGDETSGRVHSIARHA
ncbi:flavin reductase [Allorhizobium undicola]|uniref:flavin reductase n=1 Tax=Allorhizobium undicola TaxID=78527 RepID=UPI00047F7873|nr:flavin reductase family protein [Allorhizobium undicola]